MTGGGVLWIDASQGAAGDMLLGALLDVGADESAVRDGLTSLLPDRSFSLRTGEVRRHGLRALRATVEAPEEQRHRNLSDILAAVGSAGLPARVAAFAGKVFERLATAEAAVHGISADEVHFHEVGALDSIVDIVGCTLALDCLGVLDPGHRTAVVVSPVATGHGSIAVAHGVIPIPAPAVLNLLTGVPVAAHHAEMELCTPTGAALLTCAADSWGPVPACVPLRVGTGAGQRNPASHPNVMRVLSGELAQPAGPYQRTLSVVEATVDDLDPRLWPDVIEAMRAAGAADAWCSPVLARGGRPGQVLTVLTAPELVDAICLAVFAHTSTLGVRVHQVDRRALTRTEVTMDHRGQLVTVKLATLDGSVMTAKPEYSDARRAAEALGVPVRQILDEISARLAAERPGEVDPLHGR